MGIVTIALIVLIILAFGGFGYGRWYAGPLGGPAPGYASPLGLVAAILVLLLLLWLFTGGLYMHLGPPWYY